MSYACHRKTCYTYKGVSNPFLFVICHRIWQKRNVQWTRVQRPEISVCLSIFRGEVKEKQGFPFYCAMPGNGGLFIKESFPSGWGMVCFFF